MRRRESVVGTRGRPSLFGEGVRFNDAAKWEVGVWGEQKERKLKFKCNFFFFVLAVLLFITITH